MHTETFSPTKKVVLITGASSGIGESTAIAFAQAGYHVIATLRDANKATALLEKADNENLSLVTRILDVCDDHSVHACITEIIQTYGRIDILVNNAGIGYRGTLEQAPLEDIKRMMDVNFFSVARMTKAVFPYMRQARSGHIITVTSLGGLIGVPFNDIYCAAKFAVEGLMESFAPVATTMGVHVSLIEPGPVHTNFIKNLQGVTSIDDESNPYLHLEKAAYQAMAKRFATVGQSAEDIANIIVNAANSELPSLRYPTSTDAQKLASYKYLDTTGNSIVKATRQAVFNVLD